MLGKVALWIKIFSAGLRPAVDQSSNESRDQHKLRFGETLSCPRVPHTENAISHAGGRRTTEILMDMWRHTAPKCWNMLEIDRSPKCCFNCSNIIGDPYPWCVMPRGEPMGAETARRLRIYGFDPLPPPLRSSVLSGSCGRACGMAHPGRESSDRRAPVP